MSRNVITGGFLACFSLLLLPGLPGKVAAQDTVLTELYGRGVHSFHRGDYGQAHRLLETAVAEGTTDPRVHYYLGLTSYRLGDQEAAEKSFAVGAQLELDRGTSYPIGKALERVQGPERLLLEDYRDRVRTEHFLNQKARDRARYEARQAAEENILRDRTRPAPAIPTEPPVPVPPSDTTDPFGSGGGPPPAAPAPVAPSREPAEEAMTEPSGRIPATPAPTVDDPFGAPVDEDSTPPVDDALGTDTAPSMQNSPAADPFGAAPAPVGEQPLPVEPADTFGDAPPAGPPGRMAPAFGVNPSNAVENPDRERTRGTVPVPNEVPGPANTESLGEVAPFPATNDPNPYGGQPAPADAAAPAPAPAMTEEAPAADDPFGAAPAPPADLPADAPAMEADAPAVDDPFGAAPAPADEAPAPAADPFGATPAADNVPGTGPAMDAETPAADDPFGAAPAPVSETPVPADDPFGAATEPATPAVPGTGPGMDAETPVADDPFGATPAPMPETPAPADDPFGAASEPSAPADDPFGAMPAPASDTPAAAPANDPFGAPADAADEPAMDTEDAPSANDAASTRRSNPVGAAFGALSRALIPDVKLPSLPGTPGGGNMPMGAGPGQAMPAGDAPAGADPFGPATDAPVAQPFEEMPADNPSPAPASDDPFAPSAAPQDDPFGAPSAPVDDPFAN